MKNSILILLVLFAPCVWPESANDPAVISTTAIARALLLNRSVESSSKSKFLVHVAEGGISGRPSVRIQSPDISVTLDVKTGLPVSYTLNSKYLIGETVRQRIEGVPDDRLINKIETTLASAKPLEQLGFSGFSINFSYKNASYYPDGNISIPRVNDGVTFLDESAAVTMPYLSGDGISGISIRVSDDVKIPAFEKDKAKDVEALRLVGFEWIKSSTWAQKKMKPGFNLGSIKTVGLRYAHDNPKSLFGEECNILPSLKQPISLVYHYTVNNNDVPASTLFYINVDVYSGEVKGVWVF